MSEPIHQNIILKAIGYVENEIDEMVAPSKIRVVPSRIILKPEYQSGLTSLQPGDQLMVVFHFHMSDGFELLQHPRKDSGRAKRGVFALRTPSRPNPIGVTVVDLIAVAGNTLTVRGLDAINGTPVLDLKPA